MRRRQDVPVRSPRPRGVRPSVPLAPLAALAAFSIAPSSATAQPADPLAGLDSWIEATMVDWEIPGAAVGILKDGEVVFARGFGVRELGRPEPVDTRTIFGNGSTTKAFTGALLGSLVDDGLLHWDDPVVRHVPWFEVYDPYATATITIRDLLAHRTGVQTPFYQLPEYWGAPTPRNELVRRLRYEGQGAPLRSRHIYHNITYTAAGLVAEAAAAGVGSGASDSGWGWGSGSRIVTWEALLRERILEPLGMERSTADVGELPALGNVAAPHTKAGGRVFPVPWLDLANIGPAGSLASTVEDMLRWLEMLLDEGAFRGRRVLADSTVEALFAPAIHLPSIGVEGSALAAYGLGWYVGEKEGRKVAYHTGSAKGFRAIMAVVPESELGLVVFVNRHVSQYPVAVMNAILDRYLGPADAPDRSDALLVSIEEAAGRVAAAEAELAAKRVEGTSPGVTLEALAGTWVTPMLEPTTIRVENGRLVWDIGPDWIAELRHWHHDTFRVERWRDPLWEDYPGLRPFLTFRIGPDGSVDEVDIEGVGTMERAGRRASAR